MFDPTSGKIVITYQTFVVRTPKHTILIDTCTGEDKGYAAPMNFPKQPWLNNFRAAGLRFESINYVFCTHLHSDHTLGYPDLILTTWVAGRAKPLRALYSRLPETAESTVTISASYPAALARSMI